MSNHVDRLNGPWAALRLMHPLPSLPNAHQQSVYTEGDGTSHAGERGSDASETHVCLALTCIDCHHCASSKQDADTAERLSEDQSDTEYDR